MGEPVLNFVFEAYPWSTGPFMPSKTKLNNAAIAARSAALPKISNELIDQFVTGPMTAEAVNAASMAVKKALIERAMDAELGAPPGLPGRHGQARYGAQPVQRQDGQDGQDCAYGRRAAAH